MQDGAKLVAGVELTTVSIIDDGRKVINAHVHTDGAEITYRKPSNTAYGNGHPVPDEVWKEIFIIKDGKLTLSRTVKGTHTPAHMVQESIEFPN